MASQIIWSFSLGHVWTSVTQNHAISESLFESASKVFFKLKFRDKSSFGLFEAREFYPFESHILRLLDLTVLNGNDISTQGLSNLSSTVTTKAKLWNGDRVLLSSSSTPGPYSRISTTTLSLMYNQKIELTNLILDFDFATQLITPSLQNCEHQLDSGFCLVCAPNFIESSDLSSSVFCDVDSFLDTPLNKCVDLSSYVIVDDAIKKLGAEVSNFTFIDPAFIGNMSSVESKAYSYLDGNTSPPLSKSANKYYNVNVSSPSIVFVNLELIFEGGTLEFVHNPYIFLNFANSLQQNDFVQYLIDDVRIDNSNKNVIKRQTFTVDFDNDNPFYQYVNFIVAEKEKAGFLVWRGNMTSTLDYFKMSHDKYFSYLSDSSQTPNAKVHPVSFPLNTHAKTSIYLPKGLFVYEALDHLFENDVPSGFYVEKQADFLYTQTEMLI